MLLNKRELYECLLHQLIIDERYEDCCKVRDYLPYVNQQELFIIDEDFTEFDLDEDVDPNDIEFYEED